MLGIKTKTETEKKTVTGKRTAGQRYPITQLARHQACKQASK